MTTEGKGDCAAERLAGAVEELQREAEREGYGLAARLLNAASDAVRWAAREDRASPAGQPDCPTCKSG